MQDMKPSNPAKINLKNIKRFLQGWIRYIIYKLSKIKYLKNVTDELLTLPAHKEEQFKYRLQIMDSQCLTQGYCKICGCKTPQLQMSDESCEGNCYPVMLNKEDWEKFKKENSIIV